MLKSLTSWQVVVLTLVVAGIGIAPTFVFLWPKWVDSFTYSHGLLVVPFCAWLLWKQRERINSVPAIGTWLAVVPLVGLLFAWTLAFAASIEIGVEATMPLILLFAVLATAGWQVTWFAAFPILLLYSAIPVWDYINGYLQSMTTAAVGVILQTINVPAYIQGNSVQIPSGWFEIAGGCSGVHFFIVGITLAAAYGFLYLRSLRRRLILLAVGAALSIAMNWVRVASIITAGHLTDMQSFLVKVDHYYFGWVLFAVVLVPFFYFAHWLEKHEDHTVSEESLVPTTVSRGSDTRAFTLVTIGVVVLLPALVWGRLTLNEPMPLDLELPAIANWGGPAEYTGKWQPRFRHPDGEVIGSYVQDGRSFEVYVNWYQSQSQSRELIGYGNTVAGGALRPAYDRKIIDLARADHAKSLEIREIMANSRAGERRLIWYYYRVGDGRVTGAMQAKLRQGLRTMAGKDGTGLIAVSVACGTDDEQCDAARELLRASYGAVVSPLDRLLDELDND